MKTNTKRIIISLTLSAIVLGLFVIYQKQQSSEMLPDEPIKTETNAELQRSLLSGDRVESVNKVKTMIEKGEIGTSNEGIALKLTYAGVIFNEKDVTSRDEATEIVREIIEDKVLSNKDRAAALNLLVTFAYEDTPAFDASTPYLYKLSEFESDGLSSDYNNLAGSGDGWDRAESVMLLSKYSYELSPSAHALLMQAWWDAYLLRFPRPDALVDSGEAVVSINSKLKEADNLLSQEDKMYLTDWDLVNYYYWKGHTLAHAEAAGYEVQQSYTDAFDEALEKLESPDYTPDNLRTDLELFVLFNYSLYLSLLTNDSDELIKINLDKMVLLFESMKTNQIEDFSQYISLYEDAYGSSDREKNPLTKMIGASSDFGDYLSSLGWNLD